MKLCEINISLHSEEGSEKVKVKTEWGPVGKEKLPMFVGELSLGKYLDQILCSIEEANTEEALIIVKKIENLMAMQFAQASNMLKNIPQQEDDGDIPPTQAFSH